MAFVCSLMIAVISISICGAVLGVRHVLEFFVVVVFGFDDRAPTTSVVVPVNQRQVGGTLPARVVGRDASYSSLPTLSRRSGTQGRRSSCAR